MRVMQWTAKLDDQLIRLYEAEMLDVPSIACRMLVSEGAVRCRLTRLRKLGRVTAMRGKGGRPAQASNGDRSR